MTNGTVTVDKDSEALEFVTSQMTGDLGPMVAVQLVGAQDGTTAYALAAEIDVSLVLKNG